MQKGNRIISRRKFVQDTGMLTAVTMTGLPLGTAQSSPTMNPIKKIAIKKVDSNFEREPLNPYRFKGSAITEAWQTAARLESESGNSSIGLGTQGILWSDAKVFASHSESGGNALMYAM